MARTTCRPGREATRGFVRCTPRPGTIKRAMYCLLLLRSPDNKLSVPSLMEDETDEEEDDMIDVEMARTARRAVEQVLALRPGEKVLIITDTGRPVTIARALASAVHAAGAEVVVATMITRETHGVEPPDVIAEAMKVVDAVIMPTSYALTHTDAVRNALKCGTRFCNFREINEDMMVCGAVAADYHQVREIATALAHRMNEANIARITTPAGTDISMSLAGRTSLVLAGFAQQPGQYGGLPSGEAAIAPVERTAKGIMVDPFSMDGIGVIRGPFHLQVENGKVQKVSGGLEAVKLRGVFDRNDENAANIAEFAIGANPAARITGVINEDKRRIGTVHIAVGDNMTLGGRVRSNIHYDILFFDPTVQLDDETVVESGKLVI
ncbi:MAG: aminopeptidase [Deltaproteobacteria bacterium]|nr:aminopeptidase [Deltaproteobacteria bacterium]